MKGASYTYELLFSLLVYSLLCRRIDVRFRIEKHVRNSCLVLSSFFLYFFMRVRICRHSPA